MLDVGLDWSKAGQAANRPAPVAAACEIWLQSDTSKMNEVL